MHPTSALPQNFEASRRLPLDVLLVDMCSAMWCAVCEYLSSVRVHPMRLEYKCLTWARYSRVGNATVVTAAAQRRIDKF